MISIIWLILAILLWAYFIVELISAIEHGSYYQSLKVLIAALVISIGWATIINATRTSVECNLLGQKQVPDGVISYWETQDIGLRSVIFSPMDQEQYYEFKTNSGVTLKIDSDTAEKLMGLTIPSKQSKKDK